MIMRDENIADFIFSYDSIKAHGRNYLTSIFKRNTLVIKKKYIFQVYIFF